MAQPNVFVQIANDLRDQITAGDLPPGEPIPSENTLAKQYQTTRPTVRKGIALLKAEGLVVSSQGARAIVRPRPRVQMLSTGANFRDRRNTGKSNFNAEVAAQGARPEQRILSVELQPAPQEVAERLGLTEGEEVVVRRRLFLVDDEPMQLCDGYYPAALFAGTAVAEPRRIRGGVSALVEDPNGPVGQRITQFVEDLDVRMPTPDEIEDLSMPPGVPLARVWRAAHVADGSIVEVLDSRIPCDRHVFRYVIDVP
ncbi:GntR family transcriptional regulator [Streptomyces angustmyceticus]|uniref:GntR family transcriptional regulator n=1 Tax=Streptomyces angustmyceticus TaxID=285578 RepID=A0A5J4LK67_9ACTN|nr:GntR family transcriptional regulator [Streptomyces angustmyceticus]UAL68755.1 GntR family transcriptional regulator [Streptomyces angustmyceticus]GES32331.1 GntR family transcriptional regulator [Streptomyces angustmyceticus]